MQLSQLITDTRYLVSPQLTSTDYSDTEVKRNLNLWYRQIMSWAFAVMGSWDVREEFSTSNALAGQIEFVLPVDLIRITGVEVLYPNQTEYVKTTQYDYREVNGPLGNDLVVGASEGSPVAFFGDRSVFIYPGFSADVTGAVRISYSRDFIDLSTDTDLPDLIPLVHRLLSLGAAYDFADVKGMTQRAESLRRRIFGIPGFEQTGLKYDLESLYARRDDTTKPSIRVKRESYN